MKRTVSILLILALVFSMNTFSAFASGASISYRAHVQDVGDQQWFSDGQMAGTTGRAKRLEELVIKLSGVDGGLVARAHIQDKGWVNEVSGTTVTIGTRGQSLRLEALTLRLTGRAAELYSIQYRTHVAGIGWQAFVADGTIAGTTGQSRAIEAVEIRLVAKSNSTTQTYYVSTNGSNLNVRAAASQDSALLGKLSNGTEVSVYSISGSWAMIAYNGGSAYVCKDYLTRTAPAAVSFQWPMSSYKVTQRFGHVSSSSAGSSRPYHCGIDIVATTTDYSIHATAAGVVVYRGSSASNGNHIVLAHTVNGQTVYSFYAHLANFQNCPQVNGTVAKGQTIATMGSKGNSTGPHLHFGIFTGRLSTDPLGYTGVNNTTKATWDGITYYNPEIVLSGKLP